MQTEVPVGKENGTKTISTQLLLIGRQSLSIWPQTLMVTAAQVAGTPEVMQFPRDTHTPPQLCLQLQNITIEGASIVDGDNAATNGVIHVINKVKMPLPTRQNCFPLCDGFLYSAIWGQIKKILSLNIKRTLSVFHLG